MNPSQDLCNRAAASHKEYIFTTEAPIIQYMSKITTYDLGTRCPAGPLCDIFAKNLLTIVK